MQSNNSNYTTVDKIGFDIQFWEENKIKIGNSNPFADGDHKYYKVFVSSYYDGSGQKQNIDRPVCFYKSHSNTSSTLYEIKVVNNDLSNINTSSWLKNTDFNLYDKVCEVNTETQHMVFKNTTTNDIFLLFFSYPDDIDRLAMENGSAYLQHLKINFGSKGPYYSDPVGQNYLYHGKSHSLYKLDGGSQTDLFYAGSLFIRTTDPRIRFLDQDLDTDLIGFQTSGYVSSYWEFRFLDIETGLITKPTDAHLQQTLIDMPFNMFSTEKTFVLIGKHKTNTDINDIYIIFQKNGFPLTEAQIDDALENLSSNDNGNDNTDNGNDNTGGNTDTGGSGTVVSSGSLTDTSNWWEKSVDFDGTGSGFLRGVETSYYTSLYSTSLTAGLNSVENKTSPFVAGSPWLINISFKYGVNENPQIIFTHSEGLSSTTQSMNLLMEANTLKFEIGTNGNFNVAEVGTLQPETWYHLHLNYVGFKTTEINTNEEKLLKAYQFHMVDLSNDTVAKLTPTWTTVGKRINSTFSGKLLFGGTHSSQKLFKGCIAKFYAQTLLWDTVLPSDAEMVKITKGPYAWLDENVVGNDYRVPSSQEVQTNFQRDGVNSKYVAQLYLFNETTNNTILNKVPTTVNTDRCVLEFIGMGINNIKSITDL